MKRHHGFFIAGFLAVIIGGGLLLAAVYRETFQPALTRVQAVTARALTDNFEPVDPTGVFLPGEVFFLSVRVENAPPHSIISARWSYDSTIITVQDQVTGALGDVYLLGFELDRTDQPWPVGDYRVDVLLNSQAIGHATFEVQESE
jgi:hypothetical protein